MNLRAISDPRDRPAHITKLDALSSTSFAQLSCPAELEHIQGVQEAPIMRDRWGLVIVARR